MRKKFCNFLGVVLAVSLMIPGGALNAFADESTSKTMLLRQLLSKL